MFKVGAGGFLVQCSVSLSLLLDSTWHFKKCWIWFHKVLLFSWLQDCVFLRFCRSALQIIHLPLEQKLCERYAFQYYHLHFRVWLDSLFGVFWLMQYSCFVVYILKHTCRTKFYFLVSCLTDLFTMWCSFWLQISFRLVQLWKWIPVFWVTSECRGLLKADFLTLPSLFEKLPWSLLEGTLSVGLIFHWRFNSCFLCFIS